VLLLSWTGLARPINAELLVTRPPSLGLVTPGRAPRAPGAWRGLSVRAVAAAAAGTEPVASPPRVRMPIVMGTLVKSQLHYRNSGLL
jgi:hypothetical protein